MTILNTDMHSKWTSVLLIQPSDYPHAAENITREEMLSPFAKNVNNRKYKGTPKLSAN